MYNFILNSFNSAIFKYILFTLLQVPPRKDIATPSTSKNKTLENDLIDLGPIIENKYVFTLHYTLFPIALYNNFVLIPRSSKVSVLEAFDPLLRNNDSQDNDLYDNEKGKRNNIILF